MMIEPIKLAHARPGIRLVIAELFRALLRIGGLERLRVTFLQKIFPFFEVAKRLLRIARDRFHKYHPMIAPFAAGIKRSLSAGLKDEAVVADGCKDAIGVGPDRK